MSLVRLPVGKLFTFIVPVIHVKSWNYYAPIQTEWIFSYRREISTNTPGEYIVNLLFSNGTLFMEGRLIAIREKTKKNLKNTTFLRLGQNQYDIYAIVNLDSEFSGYCL